MLLHLAKETPLAQSLQVDSCGIGDWTVGESVDNRMTKKALSRGIVLSGRARVFEEADWDRYDHILVVEHAILYELLKTAKTPGQKAKAHLITAFSATYPNQDIPDPYYADDAGFDLVLDMLEDSCEGLLKHLQQ
jgi:protein-tyrosine phosphatase